MNGDAPAEAEFAFEGGYGADDQIVVAERHSRIVRREIKFEGVRFFVIECEVQSLAERDGLKNGAELVKAVRPPADDVQAGIDLRKRRDAKRFLGGRRLFHSENLLRFGLVW